MSSGRTDPTSSCVPEDVTSSCGFSPVGRTSHTAPAGDGIERSSPETELPDHVRPFAWGRPIETVGELCDFWTEPRLPEEEAVLRFFGVAQIPEVTCSRSRVAS